MDELLKSSNDNLTTSQEQVVLGIGNTLSEETLQTLEAMGEVLLRIRKRMISEGFDIVDGKVIKKSIIEKND